MTRTLLNVTSPSSFLDRQNQNAPSTPSKGIIPLTSGQPQYIPHWEARKTTPLPSGRRAHATQNGARKIGPFSLPPYARLTLVGNAAPCHQPRRAPHPGGSYGWEGILRSHQKLERHYEVSYGHRSHNPLEDLASWHDVRHFPAKTS